MHREVLVAVQVRRFTGFEELDCDAHAAFRRGSNLLELTWQARERERGGESDSKKEMSHPCWTLAGDCVFNKGQSLISIVCRDEQDRKARLGWQAYLLLAKPPPCLGRRVARALQNLRGPMPTAA
jgi:hypothetical protein